MLGDLVSALHLYRSVCPEMQSYFLGLDRSPSEVLLRMPLLPQLTSSVQSEEVVAGIGQGRNGLSNLTTCAIVAPLFFDAGSNGVQPMKHADDFLSLDEVVSSCSETCSDAGEGEKSSRANGEFSVLLEKRCCAERGHGPESSKFSYRGYAGSQVQSSRQPNSLELTTDVSQRGPYGERSESNLSPPSRLTRSRTILSGLVAKYTRSNDGTLSLFFGRCLVDLRTGDSLSACHADDGKTLILSSIRMTGTHQMDLWTIVCDESVLQCDLANPRVEELRPLLHTALHYTLFRPCPHCGAGAGPNSCSCTIWNPHVAMGTSVSSPQQHGAIIDFFIGGEYSGVMSCLMREPDGVLRQVSASRLVNKKIWTPNDQPAVVHTLSLFVQRFLGQFVYPALGPPADLSEQDGATLQPDRTRMDSAQDAGTSGHIGAERKRQRDVARKLRNRESALRSNLKRSQAYKDLISKVDKRRQSIRRLTEKRDALAMENQRLRKALNGNWVPACGQWLNNKGRVFTKRQFLPLLPEPWQAAHGPGSNKGLGR